MQPFVSFLPFDILLNERACQSALHKFDPKSYIQPKESLIFFGMRHRQRIGCTPLESTNTWLALHRQARRAQGTPVAALYPRAVKSTGHRLERPSSMRRFLVEEPGRFTAYLDEPGRKEAGVLSLGTNEFTASLALFTWKTLGLLYRPSRASVDRDQLLHTSGDEAIQGQVESPPEGSLQRRHSRQIK